MKKNRIFIIFLICLICRVAGAVEIERVSVASDGTQGNATSKHPSVSANGRFVAFESEATNLVPGDTNGFVDVFVHDHQTHETTCVSVASDGTQGDNESIRPSMSADGRFVAFISAASNFVTGDTNEKYDVFVHDRQTHETTRVSRNSDGVSHIGWSYSDAPSLNADGRYIAFLSPASNPHQGQTDIFVYDSQTHETTSIPPYFDGGTQRIGYSVWPSLSADGRYIAFMGLIATGHGGGSEWYLFAHDRQIHETTRIPVVVQEVRISADGRFAALSVPADIPHQWDTYAHNLQTHETTPIAVTSQGSNGPSINADGQFIAFASFASEIVSGDTNNSGDVFVHDRTTDNITRISIGFNGAQGNSQSAQPSISADGQVVAFASWASNLVSGDTNNSGDVFVVEWTPPPPPPPPPPSTSHTFRCEENDGGKVPTRAGKVRQFKDDNPPIIYEDTCCRKEYLKEYFCNNDTGQKEIQWYRAKECKNGAAVASSGFISPVPASDIPVLCRIQSWWQSFRRR